MKRAKHSRGPRFTPRHPAGTPATPGVDGGRGEWIYGRHPVRELLRAGRRHVYGVWLPPELRRSESEDLAAMRAEALAREIPVHVAERDMLDRRFAGLNHQGVALHCGTYPYGDFGQVLRRAADDPQALVLLLDHLEDPQNTGSLMRSAEAAGVTAVVLPRDRAVGVTPAVVRASAGAVEHLLVVQVTNLTRSIVELRETGHMQIWGLDMAPDAIAYDQAPLEGPLGLVVGGEGRGLARLTRERCDGLLRLPMRGRVESLNAAVAGGILLFEARRNR